MFYKYQFIICSFQSSASIYFFSTAINLPTQLISDFRILKHS